MPKDKKCLYTTMLSKLTDLDEQIFQMQASLAKVREMVNANVAKEEEEPPTVDKKGDK